MRRVLVTGASGFIGDAVCSRLRLGGEVQVRGQYRTAANAARVARLGIELCPADLTRKGDVQRVVDGADAIIHCAVSKEGSAQDARRATSLATEELCQAALDAGVSRFVHLSSVAVYGYGPGPALTTEETGLPRTTRNAYGDAKLETERVVERARRRGLAAVALRPGIVYGPWSTIWVNDLVARMRAGAPVVVGTGGGPANTVFIENLVDAILAALWSERSAGRTYIVTDDEGATWRDYLEGLAAEAGPGAVVRSLDEDAWIAAQRAPSSGPRVWVREMREIFRSPEARALVARIGRSPALRRAARQLVAPFPAFRRRLATSTATRVVGPVRNVLPLPLDLFQLQSSAVRFGSERIKRELGWVPAVPLKVGIARTGEWMRWARVAPGGVLALEKTQSEAAN